MIKAAYISILALPLLLGTQALSAQQTEQYLFEAVRTDQALSTEFQRIMKPIIEASPWVETYGTTPPSETETLDNKTFEIYSGCKPHDCPAENYVLMYDTNTNQITAGAFARNNYEGPKLSESHIIWLGDTSLDSARAMAKYLY